MSGLLRRYVVDPIRNELNKGLNAEGLARSITVGILGGIFPIPGTTAFACYFLHLLFKTNLIVVQVLNICVTPLQFSFAIFAMGFVAKNWGSADFDVGTFFSTFLDRIQNSPALLMSEAGFLVLLTIVFWLVTALIAAFPLYYATLFLSKRLIPRRPSKSPDKQD